MTAKTKARVIYWLVIALVPSFLILSRLASSGGSLNGAVLPLLWIVVLIVSVTLYRLGFGERAPKLAMAALMVVMIYGAGPSPLMRWRLARQRCGRPRSQ